MHPLINTPQLVNDLRFILDLVETGGASANLTNASLSLAALIKNLESRVSETPLKNASGVNLAAPAVCSIARSDAAEAVSTMAAKIARLEDENQRLRDSEVRLIKARDRLIHEDLDQARQTISTLTGDFNAIKEALQSERANYENRINGFASREAAYAQRESEQSEKIDGLQKRLHRAQEKLKNIAFALVEAD